MNPSILLSLLEPFYVIVEYTCFGSLKMVLENNRKSNACKGNTESSIDQGRLLKMAQQVASGMECIASHKVKRWRFLDQSSAVRNDMILTLILILSLTLLTYPYPYAYSIPELTLTLTLSLITTQTLTLSLTLKPSPNSVTVTNRFLTSMFLIFNLLPVDFIGMETWCVVSLLVILESSAELVKKNSISSIN